MVHSQQAAHTHREADGTVLALIERLEAAEAGDRALDIAVALETTHCYGFDSEREIDAYPNPTTSVDDALALAGFVLPKAWRGPIDICIAGSAQVYLNALDPCGPHPLKVFGNTPALALCIAILKATTANSVGTEAQPECTQKDADHE